MTKEAVAKMIDHTQLSAVATRADIEKLCAEAKTHGFASVCVNPVYVPFAASLLSGSEVKVCTVIGFPLGADATEDKAAQAANSVEKGADEVDMVIDIGAAKEGRFDDVERDIFYVVQAAHTVGKSMHKNPVVKVILETCYLTDEEIVRTSKCAKIAGADFVKTSTGFATPKDADGKSLPNGASVHAVKLMRETVGDSMGVKASGGIRSAQTAREMIEAGASRLGTSSGVSIVEGW
ncbi:MAG: deoxyribose-phosphate aldolase [Treponema sp.]|nr:deoxyribose-phosphate aldolase [Treponema sp.]